MCADRRSDAHTSVPLAEDDACDAASARTDRVSGTPGCAANDSADIQPGLNDDKTISHNDLLPVDRLIATGFQFLATRWATLKGGPIPPFYLVSAPDAAVTPFPLDDFEPETQHLACRICTLYSIAFQADLILYFQEQDKTITVDGRKVRLGSFVVRSSDDPDPKIALVTIDPNAASPTLALQNYGPVSGEIEINVFVPSTKIPLQTSWSKPDRLAALREMQGYGYFKPAGPLQ